MAFQLFMSPQKPYTRLSRTSNQIVILLTCLAAIWLILSLGWYISPDYQSYSATDADYLYILQKAIALNHTSPSYRFLNYSGIREKRQEISIKLNKYNYKLVGNSRRWNVINPTFKSDFMFFKVLIFIRHYYDTSRNYP